MNITQHQVTNVTEYTLNKLVFNRQPQTIHRFFVNIWKLDMILHKLVHMCENFQITLIVRKYVAKPNERLYTNAHFCSSCLQNLLVIGPITPNFSAQCQFIIACSRKVPCNHVHWNWDTLNTRAPTILGYFLEVSQIHSSVIWEVPKGVPWDLNL